MSLGPQHRTVVSPAGPNLVVQARPGGPAEPGPSAKRLRTPAGLIEFVPSKKVAVIGATGAVGQRFIQLMDAHPWFEVSALAASARSAGKRYEEATNWTLDRPMPEAARDMVVEEAGGDLDADIVFSAVPGGLAGDMERDYAKRGFAVFSNAKDNRRKDGIPLVITEVNASHFGMLDDKKGQGFVVTNGNCSGIVATLAMAPLHRAFGIEAAHIMTLQALSGAGYPGVPSLDVVDNLVPFIGGEEDKLEKEPQYQLGEVEPDGIVTPAPFPISSTCTRVAVIEGHSMAIHLKLRGSPSPADVSAAIAEQVGLERFDLPSAPERIVQVMTDERRPQPRKDREAGGGMTVSVGRIRADPLMSVKLFASGSNTIRGAAGQSILNAEYAVANGYV